MFFQKYKTYLQKYLYMKLKSMQIYIERLSKIFTTYEIGADHGIEHAINVLQNAQYALGANDYRITDKQVEIVLFAALLHDADDYKLFEKQRNKKKIYKFKICFIW